MLLNLQNLFKRLSTTVVSVSKQRMKPIGMKIANN